jgi:hypothetical protein
MENKLLILEGKILLLDPLQDNGYRKCNLCCARFVFANGVHFKAHSLDIFFQEREFCLLQDLVM